MDLPPPSTSDYKGYLGILVVILGSSYLPIIPLLQGVGGVHLRGRFQHVLSTPCPRTIPIKPYNKRTAVAKVLEDKQLHHEMT